MERRNDDYSDGHERYRQAPHGRPLESYEEPGAETPGPDPINSAFAPIQTRNGNFMPVVVPQPRTSEQRSSDNPGRPVGPSGGPGGSSRVQPTNHPHQPRDATFQPAGSNFRSQFSDRSQGNHVGGAEGRRPTPQPLDPNREIMPPPLTLPSGGGGSVSASRVPTGGVSQPGVSDTPRVREAPPRSSTTTSTTHDSIVPEFNSTPVSQRDHHVSQRDYHYPRGEQFTPLPQLTPQPQQSQPQHHHHHHRGDSSVGGPVSQGHRVTHSPDFLRNEYRDYRGQNPLNPPSNQQPRQQPPNNRYNTPPPLPPPSQQQQQQQQQRQQQSQQQQQQQQRQQQQQQRGHELDQVFQQQVHNHQSTMIPQPISIHHQVAVTNEQQNLGLSQPSGEVHYGNSPMESYEESPQRSRPARRTRTLLVEVPMETDYPEQPVVIRGYNSNSPNQYVHSNAHNNFAGTTTNTTAYTAHQQAAAAPPPQSANVPPRVNFNERPRPQQLSNNEPLYPSSLPPPETNQQNQQVIQPVAISPTTYHQPPPPANPSQPPPPQPPQQQQPGHPLQGFSNYNTQPHQHNCGTCIHQQQHFQQGMQQQQHPGGYYPPPPVAQPPPPQHHNTYQPMEHSGRHSDFRRVRDAPMDSDPDDDDDYGGRGRPGRRSFDRGRFRSRQRQPRHNPASRGSSHDSREREEPLQQQQQPSDNNQVALANQNPNVGALVAQARANNDLLSLSSVSQQLQMQGLNHTIGAMLVPILKDQGVQQGCREMASTFQIQAQLKEMTQQMNENYKQIIETNQQKLNEMLTQQVLPTIRNHQSGIDSANEGRHGKSNLNDAPRTPQSCNSDRSLNQSRHPDLIRTPDSSVSGTYSDTDSPHSSGRRGRGNGGGGGGGGARGFRSDPYPTERHHHRGDYSHRSTPNNDYPPSPGAAGLNRGRAQRNVRSDIYDHRHREHHHRDRHHHHHDRHDHHHHHHRDTRVDQGGNSGGYSSAQSSPIDSAMEDNFQPNSISPTQNQYSDLSVDQVCEKLQEWTQGVSDEIIENFRREKIQGRHLNYLTEYMIKKGLLSKRTEDETPHRVRPIAARLGPLKTVCRALKMHVGQAKELQTTSTEREAVGLGTMNAVCVWLRTIGLSEYDRRFSEEQVFGSALLDLSESNLIELGMDKLGDRITFMLQREMLN